MDFVYHRPPHANWSLWVSVGAKKYGKHLPCKCFIKTGCQGDVRLKGESLTNQVSSRMINWKEVKKIRENGQNCG